MKETINFNDYIFNDYMIGAFVGFILMSLIRPLMEESIRKNFFLYFGIIGLVIGIIIKIRSLVKEENKK